MKSNILIIGNGITARNHIGLIEIANSHGHDVIVMNGGIYLTPWIKNLLFVGMCDEAMYKHYICLTLSGEIKEFREQLQKLPIKKHGDFKINDEKNTGIHCIREVINDYEHLWLIGFDQIEADIFCEFKNNQAKNMLKEFKSMGYDQVNKIHIIK